LKEEGRIMNWEDQTDWSKNEECRMERGIYEIGRSNLRCRILEMFSVIPKSTQAQVLGKQLLRSGTSVGANYREAYRGRSKAEFVAKCGDSLRELEETAYWFELLVDGKIVAPERLSALRQECDELIAIFVTILKRSKETS
jgi:four helix bundle protein